MLRFSFSPVCLPSERLITALGLSPRAGALHRSFSSASLASQCRRRAGLASPLGSSAARGCSGGVFWGEARPAHVSARAATAFAGHSAADEEGGAARLPAAPPAAADFCSFGPGSPGAARLLPRTVNFSSLRQTARGWCGRAPGVRWLSTSAGKGPSEGPSEGGNSNASSSQQQPNPQPAPSSASTTPSPPGDRYLTIPNAMSLVRLAAAPYIGSLILGGDYAGAIAIMAGASVLDFLDGWVARTFNQSSVIGSYLDPLADKVLVTITAASLAVQGVLNPWLVGTMIARDVALVAGVVIYRARTKAPGASFWSTSRPDDLQVRPSTLSKVNTGLQLGLIVASLTGAAYGMPPLDSTAMGVASNVVLGTTVASFVGYVIKNPLGVRK